MIDYWLAVVYFRQNVFCSMQRLETKLLSYLEPTDMFRWTRNLCRPQLKDIENLFLWYNWKWLSIFLSRNMKYNEYQNSYLVRILVCGCWPGKDHFRSNVIVCMDWYIPHWNTLVLLDIQHLIDIRFLQKKVLKRWWELPIFFGILLGYEHAMTCYLLPKIL